MQDNSTGRVSWRGTPLSSLTYTVVDVETTGLKPQGNGITEISCLRVANGEILDSFSSLVNPERPIPPFIQSLTGIDDSMVRDAPIFRDLIPNLLEFLGESVLVAHNAPFDLSFLNYGLYCCGYRSLHNQVMDTCKMARKLLVGLPRANLDSVTSHLGIDVSGRHRAAGDAEATAKVLLRLIDVCRQRGIESDTQLMAFLSSERTNGAGANEPEKPVSERRAKIEARLSSLAERCRMLPDAPGVYIMRSSRGKVLYVGKAVSLRRRLASYFNGQLAPKTKRLMRQVESIEHRQVGSELEALLEESRLIKEHQPPFNVLLRSYQDYPFIKVDESSRFPRLVVTHEVVDDEASYFGPFRNVQSTELVLEILSKCFRLYADRCPGRIGEGCVYLQMHRCLGPCVGPEAEARHRQALDEVCRLLQQDPEEVMADLTGRMDAASERLDFEGAALYRDAINALSRVLDRRKLLAPAVEGLNVLAVCPSRHPGWAELFLFGAGRLVTQARVYAGNGSVERGVVESFLSTIAERSPVSAMGMAELAGEESLDRVNIISTWLEGRGAAICTLTLDPGWASQRFVAVVDQLVEAARAAARVEE